MTARDRLMLIGIVAVVILAGGYLAIVSPERKKAAKVSAEVQAARTQLQSAETQAREASNARTHYGAAYASLVRLGPAVPASGETPSLVYAVDSATNSRNVEFNSITSGGGSGSSSSGSASASAGAAGTTFSQEPFTFVFNGGFVDLYKLLGQLEDFTQQTASGSLQINGRLLTIDSIDLSGGSSSNGSPSTKLQTTVTATAYVLPPGQSPLGGATASGPVGASPASAASGASSPTSPAVVKVGP